MKLFIAGCARSGTTLLWRLLSNFDEIYIPEQMEQPAAVLDKIQGRAKHVAVKRTGTCYRKLHRLPEDIGLIYTVRHPFDTLTSRHRLHPGRKYYLTEARWRKEYAALKRLRAAQPDRKITYVRYSDLVNAPDDVQRHVAEAFGLEIKLPFSLARKIHTQSINKYESNAAFRRYLWLLPHDFRRDIAEFCHEFGFDLPRGYVRPPSLIGDAARRFLTRHMAKDWGYIIRNGGRQKRSERGTHAAA